MPPGGCNMREIDSLEKKVVLHRPDYADDDDNDDDIERTVDDARKQRGVTNSCQSGRKPLKKAKINHAVDTYVAR